MNAGEREEFAALLLGIAEIYNRQLSRPAIGAYWEVLRGNSLHDVQQGFWAHLGDPTIGHRMPMPADILKRLPARALSAEEAWAKAMRLRIFDEQATLVIERAILMAFPFSLYAGGDRIAARMAFKSAYEPALAEHGQEMAISLGHDPDGRGPAIQDAVRAGRISWERGREAFPMLEAPAAKLPAIADQAAAQIEGPK